MKKNIFVACDFPDKKDALNVIEEIKNDVFGIKIGLEYVTSTGVEGVEALHKFGLPIMYDVKAFDIKNTIVSFSKTLKNLKVSFATVHLLNGEETLKEAVKHSGNVKLIGVSVLTSFSDEDLKKLGFINNVEAQVEKLIKIASAAGLYGVVCSPKEVKMIKKIAPSLKCFTPGIRQSQGGDDQKRTLNARQAIEEGSDCLIIGRPITEGDPKKNIKEILHSLD